MSTNQWQDLMGSTNFSSKQADDESSLFSFTHLAAIAQSKEASADDSEFYSGVFTPAKTSAFNQFLTAREEEHPDDEFLNHGFKGPEYDEEESDVHLFSGPSGWQGFFSQDEGSWGLRRGTSKWQTGLLGDGSLSKILDTRFSRLGQTKQSAMKTAEPTGTAPGMAPSFQIGDEVQARLGGMTLKGTVQAINGDMVTVSNGKVTKEVPAADVRSLGEVENKNQEIKQRDDAEHAQQDQADKQNKKNDRIQNSVAVSGAQGDPQQMAGALENVGYKLFITYRDDAQLDRAAQEYAEWTGGEELPDGSYRQHDTAYVDEWHLIYDDKDSITSRYGFFDVVPSGQTGQDWKKGPAQGYSNRNKVQVQRREIIKPLIQAGLRATGDVQEVRVSGSLKKGSSEYTVLKIAASRLLVNPSHKGALEILTKRGLVWDVKKKVALNPSLHEHLFNEKPPQEKSSPSGGKYIERPKPGEFKSAPTEIEQDHPGAVCGKCGRTVTMGEYSIGQSSCCKADVIGEEFFH
jgi:hypothetical protein